MFGLPDGVKACLFDMDGVVTQTAVVHAAAWKEMFDEFLRARAESTGTEFVPFDAHHEYDAYVDGKPRQDGTRSFLESRGIELPEGKPDDPPGTPMNNRYVGDSVAMSNSTLALANPGVVCARTFSDR